MGAELTVVLTANLLQAITHGAKEVLVGILYLASQIELNDSVGAIDRLQIAFMLMLGMHALGNVGRQLDHFGNPSLGIAHRQIAGFQPDLTTILGHPHIAVTEAFAISQPPPELRIVRAGYLLRGAEHAVVLTTQLFQAIAHGREKRRIGIKNHTLGGELDHGKGLPYRIDNLLASRQLQLTLLQLTAKA
jgi:hypothetical protein